MEKLGYIILLAASIAWLVLLIVEMVPVFPEGVIGLVTLAGLGLLFAKALRDKIIAAKSDRYSKDVKR